MPTPEPPPVTTAARCINDVAISPNSYIDAPIFPLTLNRLGMAKSSRQHKESEKTGRTTYRLCRTEYAPPDMVAKNEQRKCVPVRPRDHVRPWNGYSCGSGNHITVTLSESRNVNVIAMNQSPSCLYFLNKNIIMRACGCPVVPDVPDRNYLAIKQTLNNRYPPHIKSEKQS